MSTKSAPWPQWPSQWVRRLPKVFEEAPTRPLAPLETRTPAGSLKTPPERAKPPEGAVLRFEDFVERPLRYSSLSRQDDKDRGRPAGEKSGGDHGDDLGSLDGTRKRDPSAGPGHADRSPLGQDPA